MTLLWREAGECREYRRVYTGIVSFFLFEYFRTSCWGKEIVVDPRISDPTQDEFEAPIQRLGHDAERKSPQTRALPASRFDLGDQFETGRDHW